MISRAKVLEEVNGERNYQDTKWGGPIHDTTETQDNWVQYINEYASGKGRATSYDFRKRMVKVAALAVAAIEANDAKN